MSRLLGTGWTLGLAMGAATIAWASRVDFASDELAPFVIEKPPLRHEELGLAALKMHVVSAVFALPAYLLLSWRRMLRFPRTHRWLGRATGTVILGGLVTSGLYLSLVAKGGLPSTIGFALSGVIVAAAMAWGVGRARAKDLVHRPNRRSSHVPNAPAGPVPVRAAVADRPPGLGNAA